MLNYFVNQYGAFSWPIAEQQREGFRRPQLGALHAIGAHFTLKSEPAIITMPTGSGKTAVLVGAAFILQARRVLVITPSRIVREQLAEEFKLLRVLKMLGAVDPELRTPSVHIVENRIEAAAEWQELSFHDVIVSTPNSISPGITGIAAPPQDFFDLVLIDEAHHGPAPSWKALLNSLSSAKQIQLTATPFRRDRREIIGKLLYNYELRQAYEDGVFGQLDYRAVSPRTGEDPDIAIASAAAAKLREDRATGLDHRLMIRTGAKTRAHELHRLYTERTGLSLNVVTGDQSLRHLRTTVEKLRSGQLDGVVCVDMLGEGFDFPNLKVAALHSPHRSLAVTLQFIGRFARTNAPNLGNATFFALASDMEIEKVKLYDEGAAWEEIIPNLSSRRIREEEITREDLATFAPDELEAPEAADLSLYSLRPYHHVKVVNMGPDIDISRQIEFPAGMQILHRHVSRELSAAVYVVRQQIRPEWTTVDYLDSTSYELIINYYDRESGLLFICSSLRVDGLYEHLSSQYASEEFNPRGPSLKRLNRVLLDLEELRFFNIGMRKFLLGNQNEAYRTLAGSSVDQAIEQSASRAFRRGHWFGSATSGGERITIGLSSASKLWSNRSTQIPQLIAWCRELAGKITSDRVPTTFSGLDFLPTGEDLAQIPENIIFVDWDPGVYNSPRTITYANPQGALVTAELLDVDIRIDFEQTDAERVTFVVSTADLTYRGIFSLETDRLITAHDENEHEVLVDGEMALDEFLNHHPPVFFTQDFASFQGVSYFPPLAQDVAPFNMNQFEVVDWTRAGVNIQNEFGQPDRNGRSVHAYLGERLVQSDAEIVFYDHGPGEMADFVAFRIGQQQLRVSLYHCKASAEPTSGGRVVDAYEVCGQAVKCDKWADRRQILEATRRRLNREGCASRFEKGTLELLEQALNPAQRNRLLFESVIVQPGFSRAGLGNRISSLLAAADSYLFEGGKFDRIRVIGSA